MSSEGLIYKYHVRNPSVSVQINKVTRVFMPRFDVTLFLTENVFGKWNRRTRKEGATEKKFSITCSEVHGFFLQFHSVIVTETKADCMISALEHKNFLWLLCSVKL